MSVLETRFNFVLIDDDSVFNFLGERVIKKSGLANNITLFSTAKEALIYFAESKENNSDDIIFLDIRMPEMDGFQFLAEFEKLDYSGIEIHMLTSSLDERDKLKVAIYPFVKGFYSKPLNNEILESVCNTRALSNK
jgi:response regulator RpfG family c-di-GMP phosphodiesterase